MKDKLCKVKAREPWMLDIKVEMSKAENEA